MDPNNSFTNFNQPAVEQPITPSEDPTPDLVPKTETAPEPMPAPEPTTMPTPEIPTTPGMATVGNPAEQIPKENPETTPMGPITYNENSTANSSEAKNSGPYSSEALNKIAKEIEENKKECAILVNKLNVFMNQLGDFQEEIKKLREMIGEKRDNINKQEEKFDQAANAYYNNSLPSNPLE